MITAEHTRAITVLVQVWRLLARLVVVLGKDHAKQ
jgi:hypothetical protein